MKAWVFLFAVVMLMGTPAFFAVAAEPVSAELKPMHFIQEGGSGGKYGGCSISRYQTTHGTLVSRGPAGSHLLRIYMPASRLSLDKLTTTPDRRTVIARVGANGDLGRHAVVAEYAKADGSTVEYETTLNVRTEPERTAPCSTPSNPPPVLVAPPGPSGSLPSPDPPGSFSSDGISFAGYRYDGFHPDSQVQWGRQLNDDGWPKSIRFLVGVENRNQGPTIDCEGFGPPKYQGRSESYFNHNAWYEVSAPVGPKGLVGGEAVCTVAYPAWPPAHPEALKTSLKFSISPSGSLRFWNGNGWTPPVTFIPPREEKYAQQRMEQEKARRRFERRRTKKQVAVTPPPPRPRHAMAAMVLPLPSWTQALVAYEYLYTPRWSIRLDGGALVSDKHEVYFGGLGIGYLLLQTRSLRHHLELGLSVMAGTLNAWPCGDEKPCAEGLTPLIKGYGGYRYQRPDGALQLRVGAAHMLVITDWEGVLLPEVSIGYRF
jgi:hypothetical protein